MPAVPSFLLPADEAERLQSLRAYDVQLALDEPVFDEIVELTARIFSLPISLIALIEAEEVHYRVNYGMPGNYVQPREDALCSTAILHNNAVVYRDLAVETNPLVTEEPAHAAHQNNVRFYAGAPLRMPDDHNIGTLCGIDHQPRNFSAPEQHTLEQMATLVAHAVVVRHTCRVAPRRRAALEQPPHPAPGRITGAHGPGALPLRPLRQPHPRTRRPADPGRAAPPAQPRSAGRNRVARTLQAALLLATLPQPLGGQAASLPTHG